QTAPEAQRALGVVGGELDQRRHGRHPRSPPSPLSWPKGDISRPSSCSNSPASRKIPWHLRHCSIVTPLRSCVRISAPHLGQVIVPVEVPSGVELTRPRPPWTR